VEVMTEKVNLEVESTVSGNLIEISFPKSLLSGRSHCPDSSETL
jgi:hypothetical protein